MKHLLELVPTTREDELVPDDYHASEIEKVHRSLDEGQTPRPGSGQSVNSCYRKAC